MSELDKYRVNGYLPTIGIECHVQLKTKTKLFSSVSNEARDAAPNTLINHICFGLPGALPVLNERAVELATRAAFALGTKPQKFSKFDRKHYFYPDLPKGYQISQYDEPIILGGQVKIRLEDGHEKYINITRAHMEEDAGKSTHPADANYSLVDLNRAGTPLLEIVSEPEIHSAAEAKAFAKELWLQMKFAGVSDVDLYHGNMRFDVNVSISKDADTLGIRTETKNLNSFRSIERAVLHEIERQITVIESGDKIVQETRGWLDDQKKTVSQRSKENAHDYRYFPDPDLPPIVLADSYIENISKTLPMMPNEWREKLSNLNIDYLQTESLLESQVEFDSDFLTLLVACDPQRAVMYANWITNIEIPLRRKLLDTDQNTVLHVEGTVRRQIFEGVVSLVDEGKLSSNTAKILIEQLLVIDAIPEDLNAYAEKAGFIQISDKNEIEKIVQQIIKDNPKPVADITNGEMKAIGYLVGQVMKATQGRANPAEAQKILKVMIGI